MDHEHLKSLKIAILVADGLEQVEVVKPRQALNQAGAETRLDRYRDRCGARAADRFVAVA